MSNDNKLLISKIKDNKFDEAVENTIQYYISGKAKEIDELILYLSEEKEQSKKFIETIVKNIKTKENIREISSAIIGLINISAKQGFNELSKEFINNIPYNSIKAKSYTRIAEIEQERGNKEKSLDNIEKALNFTEKIKNPSEKSQSYKEIALLVTKQKKFETAIKILKSINVDMEKSDAIQKILSYIIDDCDLDKRMEHLNQIADIAGTIKDANSKSESYILITRAMINSNMVYEALNLARQIKDQNAKISTLGVIIDVMAKSGKSWEAKAVAGEAKEAAETLNNKDKSKSQSLSEVIEAQIKLDMVDEALDISEDVQDAGWKAMNMTIIAEAMLKNGLVDRAIELLSKSISLVEHLDSYGSQSTILTSISEVISSIDEDDENNLNQLFDKIISILNKFDDDNLIYTVLGYISNLDLLERYDYFRDKILDYIDSLDNEKIKHHLRTIIR